MAYENMTWNQKRSEASRLRKLKLPIPPELQKILDTSDASNARNNAKNNAKNNAILSKIIKKVKNDEPLSDEEQKIYDGYQANYAKHNAKKSEIIAKVKNNEPLSDEEQRIYDKYQENKAKLSKIIKKVRNNEPLSDEEQKIYDGYQEKNAKLLKIIKKVRNHELLSDEEQRIYDNYQENNTKQSAAIMEVRRKVKYGEELTPEEQQKYNSYRATNAKKWVKMHEIIEKLKNGEILTDKEYLKYIKYRLRSEIKSGITRKGYKKNYLSKEIIGCDIETAIKILEYSYEEVYGEKFDGDWSKVHIDHMIPINWAETSEEAIFYNGIWNLQLLKSSDNESKKNFYGVVRNENHPARLAYKQNFPAYVIENEIMATQDLDMDDESIIADLDEEYSSILEGNLLEDILDDDISEEIVNEIVEDIDNQNYDYEPDEYNEEENYISGKSR